MAILLDIAYFFALLGTAPVWVARMIRHGRYRRYWSQRLGAIPRRFGLQPIVWIHGVSVGEVNAAQPLVEELQAQLPDYRVVVSSTTDTGMDRAKTLFAPAHKVFQWPLDFSWAVDRALKRLQPDLVVLMEGEAWPNFLAACNRLDIPAVIVNGRMSPDKGYPRYRKLGRWAGRLFNRLTAIGVQDESYAERFLALGTDPAKVHLTGMMKFETTTVADRLPGQDELAEAIGLQPDHRLLVAGGTGPGEEEPLLELYRTLRDDHPNLRLALVPRKPERFEDVARLIEQTSLRCIRRSDRPDGSAGDWPADAVVLGDTMGELRTFYALAEVVFAGRSLVPMGGSDMIEPAALAKPVAFGPHTFNFPQADALTRHGCVRIDNADALRQQLADWLADASAARAAGQAAQDYVRSQQGATRRNVELLCHVLGRVPAIRPGQIATPAMGQT
jgi:3-deoxy-D-manno-octulosonic-acid transferase